MPAPRRAVADREGGSSTLEGAGGVKSHPLLAAVYDRLTATLERDVLGPRRRGSRRRSAARCSKSAPGRVRAVSAAIERAGFSVEWLERFDPFPGVVPARPMIEAVARPASAR